MQRATFSSVKHPNPEVFVVRIEGHLGTRQRAAVENLVDKCRERDKTKIVLDLHGLSSMGGQIASALGEFAAELAQTGSPLCILGASDVVQGFLRARFTRVAPTFVTDLPEAEAALQGTAPVVETAEPEGPEPVAPPPAENRPGYVDLHELEDQFSRTSEPARRLALLTGLLHGANLAEACHLLTPRDGRFVDAQDTAHSVDAAGPLVRALSDVRRSVPMVDLADHPLSDEDNQLLTQLNCQAVMPLRGEAGLEGLLFLRKNLAGEIYDSAETLALDLLVQRLGSPADSAAPNEESRLQQYRQNTLMRLGRDLNIIQDEEHLLNVLMVRLIGELGVDRAIYFELNGSELKPRAARGAEISQLPLVKGVNPADMVEWTHVVQVREPETGPIFELLRALQSHGVHSVAPLRGQEGPLGVIALGALAEDKQLETEFLLSVLHQAGIAAENARAFQRTQNRTLEVARVIMSLVDRRVGSDDDSAESTLYFATRVARAMNYPAEHLRDLLYGIVLRDVGMIEIGDLVLKSPRQLSPEEWKLIQRHPQVGVEIVRSMGFGDHVCEIVEHHHERFNGEGYPAGLRGTSIPLGARIVAVCESFSAMTRKLPYRAALSREETLEILRENWEMRYDPEVINTFVRIVESEVEQRQREDVLALLQ